MPDQSQFNLWIKALGVPAVALLCGVTDRTVYNWLRRHSTPPTKTCRRILRAAPGLTFDDIAGGAN